MIVHGREDELMFDGPPIRRVPRMPQTGLQRDQDIVQQLAAEREQLGCDTAGEANHDERVAADVFDQLIDQRDEAEKLKRQFEAENAQLKAQCDNFMQQLAAIEVKQLASDGKRAAAIQYLINAKVNKTTIDPMRVVEILQG